MPIVDLVITKLHGDKKRLKKPPKEAGITVSNNSKVNDIEKRTLPSGEEFLVIPFEFESTYKPEIGSIYVEGEIAYHEQDLSTVIKEEGKGKKKKITLNEDAFAAVQNAILQESTIQSIIMAKNLKLPPPMQMPHVTTSQEKKDNKGYA